MKWSTTDCTAFLFILSAVSTQLDPLRVCHTDDHNGCLLYVHFRHFRYFSRPGSSVKCPVSSMSLMKCPVVEEVTLPLRDKKIILLSEYHLLSNSPVLFPCHRRRRSLNNVASGIPWWIRTAIKIIVHDHGVRQVDVSVCLLLNFTFRPHSDSWGITAFSFSTDMRHACFCKPSLLLYLQGAMFIFSSPVCRNNPR